jgi:diguanylate cyclase (GGDEF)-like protein
VIAVGAGVLYLMSAGTFDESIAAQSLRVALGLMIALGVSRVFADLYAFQLRNEGRRRLLESQVNSDPVTQLGNRRWFEQVLAREQAMAEQHRKALSLMIVDVDSFKMVNDRYGHNTGDDVLYQVSDTLSRAVRSSDCVARWGGDEFAVVLPETSLDEARIVAEGMRAAVLAAPFSIKDVSISVGVAQLERGEPAAALIERADRALYVAKRKGKNRVQVENDREDKEGPQPGPLVGVEDPTAQLS